MLHGGSPGGQRAMHASLVGSTGACPDRGNTVESSIVN
ncbi:hypothetical protein BSU04_05670 [Caballeronia sordidicola]|uniref:Uncharacterized protein n=1 Tax=Caballeronia sordidicola TaxID=196367 RepID=A0A226X9S0_CABSO|nr:hypothetical protein BSU04_05670 [Caballeronia sordidicola]